MEHYITQIYIKKLRHLSDITISLNTEKKQHLLLTGKNGSGKTTLLMAIEKYLESINNGCLNVLNIEYPNTLKLRQEEDKRSSTVRTYYKPLIESREKYKDGIEILFNYSEDLDSLYQKGDFIIAFFKADRKNQMTPAKGVEDIKLRDFYDINSNPGAILLKYMVHLKTQQAYARNEGDMVYVDRIQSWFDRFESALKVLLDNDTISLKYDYKEYDFKIYEEGRSPFGFNELPDGYSSVIYMVSDLILRMDKNWILNDELSSYDIEGIVLIDELETHLHIELQKKILPFLTKFFPGIQFIVTTHSPYILNSISNAKVYDLEKHIELENLSYYSSEELAEGYFDSDEYSEELINKRDHLDFYSDLKEFV